MQHLSKFINIKRKNAVFYMKLLSNISSVSFMWEQPWAKWNLWFYTIKVPKDVKSTLLKYLIAKNIQVRPIWKLIHTLPMYRKYQTYFIHNAIKAYNTCFNLPCSVNLRQEEIKYVVNNIKDFFAKSRFKLNILNE